MSSIDHKKNIDKQVTIDSLINLDQAIFVAFEQAQQALDNLEVPIGCSILDTCTGEILCKGRNRTNETRNASRHAEIEALEQLFSIYQNKKSLATKARDLSLIVTIEPCIMCIAALRLAGITSVYIGAMNERFGGCGSIISAHTSAYMSDLPEAQVTLLKNKQWRVKAVMLLRQFYMNQNKSAPMPRKKVNRVLKEFIIKSDEEVEKGEEHKDTKSKENKNF